MSDVDIKSMMSSLYPTLTMDTETERFLKEFLQKYRREIVRQSKSRNLHDIEKSFLKIVPSRIKKGSILTANEFLINKKNTAENGSIFLDAVVNFLAGALLQKIIGCSTDTKQKKVYPSCVIWGIAEDKDLSFISELIGFKIPIRPSSKEISDDPRTKKELRKLVHKMNLKGVKHFSKEQLLFLLTPYREEESEESEDSPPVAHTNNLIKFYTNLYPANNKKDYYFRDIVGKWDDYKLEVKHDFIQWLFPDNTGGVNPKAPKLTKRDVEEFRKNPVLRSNVVKATLRMLLFYGFTIKGSTVEQVLPLNRRSLGRTIGLFSTHNYKRITRILDFLVHIKMEYLSALFFLAMCQAIKSNHILLSKVVKNRSMKKWMSTQPFLIKHVHTYSIDKMTGKQPKRSQVLDWTIDDPSSETDSDWRKDFSETDDDSGWKSIPSDLLYNSTDKTMVAKTKKSEKKSVTCKYKVRGLDYVSNSCYMDSTLLSLFAIPNKVITDNILNKNLDSLEDIPMKWTKCSDNIEKDIKRRKDIQTALNKITNSMRGLDKIKKCTMLRRLIAKCPGTQPFHLGGTQDAGEFLAYLFNIFQVDIAKTTRKTYGTNDKGKDPNWELIRTHVDKKTSPIIDIVSTTLKDIPKDYNIAKFLKKTEYTNLDESERWYPDRDNKPALSFLRKKEVFKMKKSPYVVFNIIRTYGEAKFSKSKKPKFLGIQTKNIWKRVVAPEKLTLKGKELNLSAIVVHTGGAHYVANFKCENDWFWYDDSPGSSRHIIRHIGTYDKMLKTKPNPLSHGTLFFYT